MKKILVLITSGFLAFSGVEANNKPAHSLNKSIITYSGGDKEALKKRKKQLKKRAHDLKVEERTVNQKIKMDKKEAKLNKKDKKLQRRMLK